MSTLLEQTTSETLRTPSRTRYVWLTAAFLIFSICTVHIIRGSDSFGTYRSSGSAVAHGLNPYVRLSGTAQTRVIFDGRAHLVQDVNLNPPCMLPFFELLSRLSYDRFATVWTIGSLLFLLASIGLLIWDRPAMNTFQILWLAFASPVFDTVFAAQIYFFLMFLSTLVWVLARRNRDLPASIALGLLVAIKPIAFFWPLFLLLSGQRKLALRSIATATGISLLPLAIYGPAIFFEWFTALKVDDHWMVPIDVAIVAEFRRFGMGSLGVAIAAAIAVLLAWLVWTRRPDLETTSGIALCAMLLCSPLAWYDYALMLAPVFVGRRWSKLETAAAILFMVALPTAMSSFMYGSFVLFEIAGWECFVAACIILGCYVRRT